ncbi:MAG: hypothetical protein J6Y62_05835 [Clostridia bacterium]|nr:hypothetical protein [Clostridia bacterium]
MMKEEFEKFAGDTVDGDVYTDEIEPTYLTFDKVTKKGLALAYSGKGRKSVAPDGGCSLWMRLNQMHHQIQANVHRPNDYNFRTGCEAIVALFKESDKLVRQINRL